MVEPVVAQYILLAALSGAMVVLFGAAYAALYAWSKIKKEPYFLVVAYFAYSIFVVFVALLTYTLHLTGFWYLVVTLMIVGYFFAPYGVWRLCVGTHKCEDTESSKNNELDMATR